MKTYWGTGGTAPLNLNLDTSLALWSLNSAFELQRTNDISMPVLEYHKFSFICEIPRFLPCMPSKYFPHTTAPSYSSVVLFSC